MRRSITMLLILLLGSAEAAFGQPSAPGITPDPGVPSTQVPSVLSKVAYVQRLNDVLPLDVIFKDEDGKEVSLGQYFGKRPVILVFVYFECAMLCTPVLNGLTASLIPLDVTAGRDFDVIAVSFDPRETPVLASGKKKTHVDRYGRPQSSEGWHFLTGDQASIDSLTSAAKFEYAWTRARSSSLIRAASW